LRRRLYPPACKPYGLEAKPEANIQGFRRKTSRPFLRQLGKRKEERGKRR